MIKKMVAVCFAISVVLFGNIAVNAENNNEAYLGNMAYRPIEWNTRSQLGRKYCQLRGGEYASDAGIYAETLKMTGHVVGDLNGDGIPDAIVVLVHSFGGSGSVLQMAAVIGYPGRRLEHVASINLGKGVHVIYVDIGRGGKIEVKLTTDDNLISCRTYHFRGNRITKG
ncbi:MAG: hypothetical protein HGB37_01300 [Candidatus Moranbacteria bacterium]|nr:hypothetical protein [Candidatus Moranbacteria bacterium]